jgi:hypothetical protein
MLAFLVYYPISHDIRLSTWTIYGCILEDNRAFQSWRALIHGSSRRYRLTRQTVSMAVGSGNYDGHIPDSRRDHTIGIGEYMEQIYS